MLTDGCTLHLLQDASTCCTVIGGSAPTTAGYVQCPKAMLVESLYQLGYAVSTLEAGLLGGMGERVAPSHSQQTISTSNSVQPFARSLDNALQIACHVGGDMG